MYKRQGGDHIGARAIGGYAPKLNKDNTIVYYVLNAYCLLYTSSRMIATLEKELNTKLFARSAHKTLELTESGKLYYEMFEKCRREFEETKRKSELIQRENTDITTLKFGYVRGWSITCLLYTSRCV